MALFSAITRSVWKRPVTTPRRSEPGERPSCRDASEIAGFRAAVLRVQIHFPPAERWYGAGGEMAPSIAASTQLMECPMPQPNDLSRSLFALDQNSTIIAVVEMSQSSWLVGGILPGIERQPRKKLEPSAERLLALLHRWRDESVRAGQTAIRLGRPYMTSRQNCSIGRECHCGRPR